MGTFPPNWRLLGEKVRAMRRSLHDENRLAFLTFHLVVVVVVIVSI